MKIVLHITSHSYYSFVPHSSGALAFQSSEQYKAVRQWALSGFNTNLLISLTNEFYKLSVTKEMLRFD